MTDNQNQPELLPLPHEAAYICHSHDGQERNLYWSKAQAIHWNAGKDFTNLFTADQMREYALANMSRNTNEGQDGLAEDIQSVVSGLQSFLDRVIHHSETGVIHPELYESDCDTLRSAITHLRHLDRARHLSSKQADHFRDATQMVKADAVKMQPAWTHVCNALCVNDLELWCDRCPHCGKPAPIGHDEDKTAEAVRELVDGIREWIDATPGYCGTLRALLAKYAPAQEGKNGG